MSEIHTITESATKNGVRLVYQEQGLASLHDYPRFGEPRRWCIQVAAAWGRDDNVTAWRTFATGEWSHDLTEIRRHGSAVFAALTSRRTLEVVL